MIGIQEPCLLQALEVGWETIPPEDIGNWISGVQEGVLEVFTNSVVRPNRQHAGSVLEPASRWNNPGYLDQHLTGKSFTVFLLLLGAVREECLHLYFSSSLFCDTGFLILKEITT